MLDDPRLSARVSALLAAQETTIVVSAVSGHEIATKHRIGKLAVPERLAANLHDVIEEAGWQALALSVAHGQLAGRLAGTHRDPFDRMLAAQALIEDIPIVTNDRAFASFGVKVVW